MDVLNGMESMFNNFTRLKGKTQKLIRFFYKNPFIYNDCLICHFRTGTRKLICPECMNDLSLFPLGYDLLLDNPKAKNDIHHEFIDGITLAAEYDWPFDLAIPQLKFHQNIRHAKWLSQLLSQQLDHLPWPTADLICPIPLHQQRLSERGYNQAELLCRSISTKIPVDHVLTRSKATFAQSELSKNGRLKNVKGAFTCNEDLADKRILIIDDVLTTGATLNEAAKTLKEAGAKSVYVAAVAVRLLK